MHTVLMMNTAVCSPEIPPIQLAMHLSNEVKHHLLLLVW